MSPLSAHLVLYAADIPIEIAAQGSLVNSRYDMDRPKIDVC